MSLLCRLTAPAVVRMALLAFVVTLPILGWSVQLGVALTPSHFAGLAVMALAAAAWWQRPSVRLFDAATVPIIMLVAAALASMVAVQLRPDAQLYADTTHAKSLKQFVGLLYGAGLFLSLTHLLRTYDLAPMTARTHHWTATVVAVLTLVQFAIASYSITSPLANFPVSNSTLGTLRPLSMMYGFPRVSLTMIEPSLLATYLISAWAMWLYGARLSRGSDGGRWPWLVSGVLLGVGLVATGSRLAYMVAAVLAAGALLVRPNRGMRLFLLMLTVVLGASMTGYKQGGQLIATLMPKSAAPTATASRTIDPRGSAASGASASTSTSAVPGMPVEVVEQTAERVEQMAGTLDISVQQRAASYLVALEVFRHSPVFGAGWGTSMFYMEWLWPASFTPLDQHRTTAPMMMSHAATILTEMGLLGTGCVLLFGVGVALTLWSAGRAEPERRDLAWGLAAAVGSYVMASFAATLIVYQILLVWLLFGMAVSLRRPASGRTRDAAGDAFDVPAAGSSHDARVLG